MLWLISKWKWNWQEYLFYLLFSKCLHSLKGLWGSGGLYVGGGGGFVYFDLVLWVGADALVSDMIKHQSPCPMGIDVRCLYYTYETPVIPEEPDYILRPLTLRCSRSSIWSVWSIMFFLPKKKKKKETDIAWALITITSIKGKTPFPKNNGRQHSFELHFLCRSLDAIKSFLCNVSERWKLRSSCV